MNIKLLYGLVLVAGFAWGQGLPISQRPPAILPLTGTELVPLVQGKVGVQTAVRNLPGNGGGGISTCNIAFTGSALFTITGTPVTTNCTGTVNFAYAGTGAYTAPLKGNGSGGFNLATASDIYGLWSGTCNNTTYLRGDGACATPAGAGTMTSAALTMPSAFTVSGSPITTTGTFSVAYSGTPIPVGAGGTGVTALSGLVKANGGSPMTAATSADVIADWTGTCNSTTFLRADGQCQPGGAINLSAFNILANITGSPAPGTSTALGNNMTLANGVLAATQPTTLHTGGYTILAADYGTQHQFCSASSMPVVIPVGTASGFTSYFAVGIQNSKNIASACTGTGSVVVTPASGTIGGSASLTIPYNTGCVLTSIGTTDWQLSECTATATGTLAAIANNTALANTSGITALPIATALGSQMIFNVKSYGAIGDNVANDLAAFNATMAAINNAWAASSQAAPIFYMPAGVYLLDPPGGCVGSACTMTPPNQAVPVFVRGDGTLHTFVHEGLSYTGPAFSWSETLYNCSQPTHGAFCYGTSTAGAGAEDFTITADAGSTFTGSVSGTSVTFVSGQAGTTRVGQTLLGAGLVGLPKILTVTGTACPCTIDVSQGAIGAEFLTTAPNTLQAGLAFYDRNDRVRIRNMSFQYLWGSGITIGHTKNKTQAYMRDSDISDIEMYDVGALYSPAFMLSSTTSVSGCDATNEVKVSRVNIIASGGAPFVVDSQWLPVNSTSCVKGTDDIQLFGIRIEDPIAAADNLRFGAGTISSAGIAAQVSALTVNTANPGVFTCTNAPCTDTILEVGELVYVSGTAGGTGAVTGYSNPTTYAIGTTDGYSYFTLQPLVSNLPSGTVATTAGTITGLTFGVHNGTVYSAQIIGLECVSIAAGSDCLKAGGKATIPGAANNLSNIIADVITNTVGNSGAYGIVVEQGKNLAFKNTQFASTLTDTLVVGPSTSVSSCIMFDTFGNNYTTSIDATSLANVSTGGTPCSTGYRVDSAGNISFNSVPYESATLPTIASGFNTSGGSVTAASTASFKVTVGSGTGTSVGVLTMPAATHGWACSPSDNTTPASHNVVQTGNTTTSVTVTDYSRTAGTAQNMVNGDVIQFLCGMN